MRSFTVTHVLGGHEARLLRDLIDALGRNTRQLEQLERNILNRMATQEQALQQALGDLRTEIVATQDRVIAKLDTLGGNHPDLTDEIQDIREDILALRQIAADAPPPIEEPTEEAA